MTNSHPLRVKFLATYYTKDELINRIKCEEMRIEQADDEIYKRVISQTLAVLQNLLNNFDKTAKPHPGITDAQMARVEYILSEGHSE